MAQALVPLKDLVTAKTRLSGLLRPGERRALAQAMVEDVLAVLTSHSEIERVTLVSDDPGADLLACKYGIDLLEERTLCCHGLNPVIDKSCDQLLALGESPLIVSHGDLPLLSSEDISAALKAQRDSGGLVIGCDRLGVGTNLLTFDRTSRPRFAFGADSCARHGNSGRSAGTAVSILRRPGIGLDVDQPGDLALLLSELRPDSPGHTATLLMKTEMGKRIGILLRSLDNGGLDQARKTL